jgi:hypothetical protein
MHAAIAYVLLIERDRDMRNGLAISLALLLSLLCNCRGKSETVVQQKPNAPNPNNNIQQAANCGCPPDFRDVGSFTTYLRYGLDDDFHEIQAVDVNGKAVFEGDIVLGTTADRKALAEDVRNAGGLMAVNKAMESLRFRGQALLNSPSSPPELSPVLQRIEGHRDSGLSSWPSHRVPYTYQASFPADLRTKVEKAMADWQQHTQLKFVPKDRTDTRYILFQVASGDACYWDGQVASVVAECARHEIGHALGLLHEQTRNDRDGFVIVHREDINPRHCSQFLKNTLPIASCGGYDFKSIMHYEPYAFSCNGKVTIEAKGSNKIQYDGYKISDGDYKTVNVVDGVDRCK